jgi:hypothetical protein
MSGENARVKAGFLLPEAEFGVLADADGSSATFMPCEFPEDLFPKKSRVIVPRGFGTARNKRLPHRLGMHKGEITLRYALSGFPATVVTPGSPPPATLTYLDHILRALMGQASSHDASAVAALSTTTSVLTSTNEMNAGDLMCLYGATTNGGLAQWARAQQAVSPFTVAPELLAAPAAADISVATRTYAPLTGPNLNSSVGPTCSLLFDEDGEHCVMPGGRPQNLIFEAEAGLGAMMEIPWLCATKEATTFSSLAAAPVSDPDPMIFLSSRINVNGEELDCTKFRFDAGYTVAESRSQRLATGRQDWRVIGPRPKLEIDPLNDTDFEALFEDETVFQVLITIGVADMVNNALNTIAIEIAAAQITDFPNKSNDGGIVRRPLVIEPVDAAATGYLAPLFRIGIA